MLNITLKPLKNGGAVLTDACWSGLPAQSGVSSGMEFNGVGVPVAADSDTKAIMTMPAAEIPTSLGVVPLVSEAPAEYLGLGSESLPLLLKTPRPRIFVSGSWVWGAWWNAKPKTLFIHQDDVVPRDEGNWSIDSDWWDGACALEAVGRLRLVGVRASGSMSSSVQIIAQLVAPALSRAEWRLLGMICAWPEAGPADPARPLFPADGTGAYRHIRHVRIPADAGALKQAGIWPNRAVYADERLDSLLCAELTLRDPVRAAKAFGRRMLAGLPVGTVLKAANCLETRHYFKFAPEQFADLEFAARPELASVVILEWPTDSNDRMADLVAGEGLASAEKDSYILSGDCKLIAGVRDGGLVSFQASEYGSLREAIVGPFERLDRDFIRKPVFAMTHVAPAGVKPTLCYGLRNGMMSSSFEAYARALVANAETLKAFRVNSRKRKSGFKERVEAELGFVPESFRRLRHPSEEVFCEYLELYRRVKAGELIERDMFVAELRQKAGIEDKDCALMLWRDVCCVAPKEERKFITFEPARCEFESAAVASVESLVSERICWLFKHTISASARPFVRRLLQDDELRGRLELALLTGEQL